MIMIIIIIKNFNYLPLTSNNEIFFNHKADCGLWHLTLGCGNSLSLPPSWSLSLCYFTFQLLFLFFLSFVILSPSAQGTGAPGTGISLLHLLLNCGPGGCEAAGGGGKYFVRVRAGEITQASWFCLESRPKLLKKFGWSNALALWKCSFPLDEERQTLASRTVIWEVW